MLHFRLVLLAALASLAAAFSDRSYAPRPTSGLTDAPIEQCLAPPRLAATPKRATGPCACVRVVKCEPVKQAAMAKVAEPTAMVTTAVDVAKAELLSDDVVQPDAGFSFDMSAAVVALALAAYNRVKRD